MLKTIGRLVTSVAVAVTAASAQDRSAPAEPSFEVSSVRPSTHEAGPEGISVRPDGTAYFTRMPLRTLITIAHRAEGIQRFDQIVGAPAWIASERFDVTGKVSSAPSGSGGPEQVPRMLRTLLRDRFALRVHTETRSVPAYAVVLAGRNRRLGPGLHESTAECSERGVTTGTPDTATPCGVRAAGGVVVGTRVPLAQLAGYLAGLPDVDRFVTDRTGLSGRYDFMLEYAPGPVAGNASAMPEGASLFTALIEQLGLRLQSERLPVPVLVIDRVERPTPD
jgi:uncharacterized protein (TIGR03435 family)